MDLLENPGCSNTTVEAWNKLSSWNRKRRRREEEGKGQSRLACRSSVLGAIRTWQHHIKCQKTTLPGGLIPGVCLAPDPFNTAVNGKGWTWKDSEWKTIKLTTYFLIPFMTNSGLMIKISLQAPYLVKHLIPTHFQLNLQLTGCVWCLSLKGRITHSSNYLLAASMEKCSLYFSALDRKPFRCLF